MHLLVFPPPLPTTRVWRRGRARPRHTTRVRPLRRATSPVARLALVVGVVGGGAGRVVVGVVAASAAAPAATAAAPFPIVARDAGRERRVLLRFARARRGAESGARPRRPRGLGRGRGRVVVLCRVEPGRASSEGSRIQPQRLGHCDRRARALSSQACSSVPCARADQSSVFHQRREKFDAWHNACVTALPGNNSETSAAGTATGTRAPALPSATLQHLFVVALTRTA